MPKIFLLSLIAMTAMPAAMIGAAKYHPDIRTEKKEEEIKDKQGQSIMKINYSYPQIQNPGEDAAIEAVNKLIETYAMGRYEANYKEGRPLAEEFLQRLNESKDKTRSSLLPFTLDLRYETMLDTPEIVSFLWEESNYFGGAHPDTRWEGAVYDLKSGKQLKAEDILSASDEEVKHYIANAFEQKSKEQPGIFFKEEVQKLFLLQFAYHFYLNEEGMVFFLEPYAIAPYVAGRVEVLLPYKEGKSYFREEILSRIQENGRN